MTNLSYTKRIVLAVLSLIAWGTSSASAAVRTVVVADSAYTSTSPVVSRSWSEVVADEEAAEEKAVRAAIKVLKTHYVDITAYTSAVEECDSDPFISADGSVVFDGMVAANFLPFGTKLRIPDHYGDKVFEVRDRMNTRYTYRIDIWKSNKPDMYQWGLKRKTKVEIIEMGTNAHKWNDPDMKAARKLVAKRTK